MTDQLRSLYVASLFLALIGLLVLVNALLASGLRWLGRRIVSRRHGKNQHGRTRATSRIHPFARRDSATATTPPGRLGVDQPHHRFGPH